MPDEPMPQEMIQWMRARNWGPHHDEWHYCRRFDYWPALAAQGNAGAADRVAYAQQQGWQRIDPQEGAAGAGLVFLAMHRAMLTLLAREFPQHFHFLRGWPTPPLDPSDVEDPVIGGAAFDDARRLGIQRAQTQPDSFASEDEFGTFVETNLAPVSGDPLARHADQQRGAHNYLHNRWTDTTSAINLGDPRVNFENARFWKLHGWIDHQWWRFRRARQLSDTDPAYRALIDSHLQMMDNPHAHHHSAPHVAVPRPAAFSRSFAD